MTLLSFSKGEVTGLRITLATIGGSILFLVALCCCIKSEWIKISQAKIAKDGKNSSPTNLTRRYRQSTQDTSNNSPNESTVTPYLTEEKMDNYFPEIKFEDLKSTFGQSS